MWGITWQRPTIARNAPHLRKIATDSSRLIAALLPFRRHSGAYPWFTDYDKTEDDKAKQKSADKIRLALTVHTQTEEEFFYPAAYDAIEDDDLLDEAEVEHASAKKLIAQIQAGKVGDPLFDAKVRAGRIDQPPC
ncbi:hemerythrin domain-containing protein [Novosphingobium terrae]|uniref:hypothetical protein n=1 Tax=Novosphingobium terrae TaxID=2726189 RepID=UPI0019801571|nr:hypothetical protein [Novosphingobium terrae]